MTEESINKSIGEKLRSLRKMKGINQSDIGKILGVSFQQVQKYENGQNRICGAKLKMVADYLQAPITSFFPSATQSVDKPVSKKFGKLMVLAADMDDKALESMLILANVLIKKGDKK